jgi:hypothetical protein
MPIVDVASPPQRPGQALALAEGAPMPDANSVAGDVSLITFEGIVE